MRNDFYAMYQNKEYSAGFKNDGRIVLRSKDMEDVGRGFEYRPNADWSYIKYIDRRDLESLYRVHIHVKYKGHDGYFVTENGDQVLITINGLWPDTAKELEMDRTTDNGIYEKWIDKDKVEMWEEIEEYKL